LGALGMFGPTYFLNSGGTVALTVSAAWSSYNTSGVGFMGVIDGQPGLAGVLPKN
jgi:hypothetical protein